MGERREWDDRSSATRPLIYYSVLTRSTPVLDGSVRLKLIRGRNLTSHDVTSALSWEESDAYPYLRIHSPLPIPMVFAEDEIPDTEVKSSVSG